MQRVAAKAATIKLVQRVTAKAVTIQPAPESPTPTVAALPGPVEAKLRAARHREGGDDPISGHGWTRTSDFLLVRQAL